MPQLKNLLISIYPAAKAVFNRDFAAKTGIKLIWQLPRGFDKIQPEKT